MQTALKIRKMKRSDAESVAKMMKALAAYHGDESKAGARDFLSYGLGSAKLATIWMAASGAPPAGFAVTYDWMNFVRVYPIRHVDLLFVQESIRRMGVGSALIKRIVSDAKSSGVQRVTVGADKENEAASSFYQRMGFELRDDPSIQYQLVCANFDRLASGA